MSWVKLDDQLHAHPKLNRAYAVCKASLGLHLLAMSYSACYDLDGFVDDVFVLGKLPIQREREMAVEALVANGLWEPVENGWRIHDWAEYNGNASTREEVRAAKSAAGKAGAAARWGLKQGDNTAMAPAIAPAIPSANGEPMAPSPSPTPEGKDHVEPSRLDAAQKRLKDQADEQTVFDEWITVTGRTGRTVFDDKRRRRIQNALKHYPLDEVLDAVRGVMKSPHHTGQNDTNTIYTDLDVILRSSQQLEKFRDLQRRDDGTAGMKAKLVA